MGFRDRLRDLKRSFSPHSNQASGSNLPKSTAPPQVPITHQSISQTAVSTQGVSNAPATPPVTIPSSSNPPPPAPSQPIQAITGPQVTPQPTSSCQNPPVLPNQPAQPTAASRKVIIRSLWDDAVEKLSTEDQEFFKTSTNDKLNTLELFIEETKKKRDEYEENQWKCTSYVDKFLTQLDKLAKVGDVFIKQSPSIVAMPWTGFRFLLQIPLNNIEIIENVLLALEYIAHTLGRCAIYEQLYLEASNQTRSARNLRAALSDLYASILVYLSKSRKHLTAKFTVRALHSTWDPYISRFKPLMDNIKDFETTMERNARAARDQNQDFINEKHDTDQRQQMEKLQEILEMMTMPQIQQDLEELRKYIEENTKDSERNAILKWLSEVYYQDHHSLISSNRHPGSGEWLIQHEKFIGWKESTESSILWLHGSPGAGKTNLVSAVIDRFMVTRRKKEAIAFFYCKYDQEERRDPPQILRAIVKQLSTVEPGSSLPQSITKLYKDRMDVGNSASSLTISESVRLLIETTADYESTLICIDALDECNKETRQDLLDALQKILRESPSIVKVFVASRDDRDITLCLNDLPNVHIQPSDNNTDISRFVMDKVDELANQKKLMRGFDDIELRTTIKEYITSRVGGMFLWASLQIQSLCREKTRPDLERAMKEIPDGLDQTFRAIVDRIKAQSPRSKARAEKALKLILGAQRPLSSQELVQALDMESKGEVIAGGLTPDVVLEECQNFVIFDQKLEVFRFAHLSVNDFIKTLFSEDETHADFAEVCLKSLLWQKWEVPLVKYALECWYIHIQLSNAHPTRDNLVKLQKELLLSAENFRSFLGLIITRRDVQGNWYGYSNHEFLNEATPWDLVCAYGLFDMCLHFLDLRESLNPYEIDTGRGLCFAAAYKRENVFKQLLEIPCIDVNTKYAVGGSEITSLIFAIYSGSEAIVKMLLAREDTDVNCKGDGGGTPLMYAADSENEAIVKMLLAREDTDVNHKADGENTALLYASREGSWAIVEMLLAREDIDVNCKGVDGGTPLIYAAGSGSEDIVKMLLAREDIDVNCKEDSGRTPLMYAAGTGSEAIVKMLLAREDIDVNCKKDKGKTAFMYAAGSGSEAIVKMLLAREDIDVNCKGDDGWTPLIYAADSGSEAIVKILLAREGIDINCKGDGGGTPLIYAADSGSEAIVKMLLAREDIDVNCKEDNGWTPLMYAAGSGSEAIVKMLLAREDTDINCKADGGNTALLYASREGSWAIVEMLLARKGINVNCKNNHVVTPLHYAVWKEDGDPKLLLQLLARDELDVKVKDADGETPVYYAVYKGNLQGLKHLLAREDIDINCANNEGDTPLRRAIRTGQEEAIKLLFTRSDLIVEKGLDYESSDLSERIKAELAARMVKEEPTDIGEART